MHLVGNKLVYVHHLHGILQYTAQYVYGYLVIESKQLLEDWTSRRQFQLPCKFLVRDFTTFIRDNMWRQCEYFFFNISLCETEKEIRLF